MAYQTSDDIRIKLQMSAPQFKETFHITELGLFGSYVRGSQKRSSDVDILVSFAYGHKDLFNYVRCKNFLENLLNTKVDLVIKDALKPRLKEKILDEVEYV